MRLFVLEETRHSVEAAERHGEIHYVFPPGTRRCAVWDPKFGPAVLAALEEQGFDHREDAIVLTGHLLSLLLFEAAVLRQYPTVITFMYDAPNHDYVKRTL